MKKELLNRFGLVFFLALTGCGTAIQAMPLNASPAQRQPLPPERVAVFTSGRPSAPYVEIAMLEARQDSTIRRRSSVSSAHEPEKWAATELSFSERATRSWGGVSNGSRSIRTRDGYRATCIVWANGNSTRNSP